MRERGRERVGDNARVGVGGWEGGWVGVWVGVSVGWVWVWGDVCVLCEWVSECVYARMRQ